MVLNVHGVNVLIVCRGQSISMAYSPIGNLSGYVAFLRKTPFTGTYTGGCEIQGFITVSVAEALDIGTFAQVIIELYAFSLDLWEYVRLPIDLRPLGVLCLCKGINSREF